MGWFNGSPRFDGLPAVTARVARESGRSPPIVDRSDQRRSESTQLYEWQLAWRIGEHLETHVAGAGVAMLRDSLGDRRLVAPRDECIDQPIAATVGEIAIGEHQSHPVARGVRS